MSDHADIPPIDPVDAVEESDAVARARAVRDLQDTAAEIDAAAREEATATSRARASSPTMFRVPPRPVESTATDAVSASMEQETVTHQRPHAPADVEQRAAVHDAAMHHDPIAAAIERAHTADPTDRAQQLAGASARASSGQAARIQHAPPDAELVADAYQQDIAAVDRVELDPIGSDLPPQQETP